MSSPFVRLGDPTSHGGTVISADPTTTFDGKPVARVGDMTVCPKCKGVFAITCGAGDVISNGQAMARQGDSTACGASLVATQAVSTWDSKTSFGEAVSTDSSDLLTMAKAIADTAPTICLECLAKAAANGTAMVVRD